MGKERPELHDAAVVIIRASDAVARDIPDGRGRAFAYRFPDSESRIDMHVIELSPTGADGRFHFHSQNENIYLILEGAARLRLADRIEPLSAGDVVWIPARVPHAVAADPVVGARLLEIYWPTPSDFVEVDDDGTRAGSRSVSEHPSEPRSDP
jgi:mannose-6-phosphate isomerase-like protein (cupin superfamily)